MKDCSIFLNKNVYYSAILLAIVMVSSAKSQEEDRRRKPDLLSQKVDLIKFAISEKLQQLNYLTLPLDTSLNKKNITLIQMVKNRIDSIESIKNFMPSFRKTLDSLERSSTTYEKKDNQFPTLDDYIKTKLPNVDDSLSMKNSVYGTTNNIQSQTPELGINTLNPNMSQFNAEIFYDSIAGLGFEGNQMIDISYVKKIGNVPLPSTQIPGIEKKPLQQILEEGGDFRGSFGKVEEQVQQVEELNVRKDQYKEEIQRREVNLANKAETLPSLAEQQATQLEEVKALQAQQAATTKQLEEHKKLIEQYKEEKRIHEELKEKTKELATEKITQNQSKVDDAMKKIGKYKRKFSQVHDMRNLPKRAPNPMKGVSWRERVVPGLTFQTFSGENTWLEFDPQVYYKLNGNLSAGIGGMYRFSLNPSKFTFDDFGSMTGAKIFAQYHITKGFFARGEVQYVRWKPWDLKLTDPYYVDHTFVAAAGIGKGYQIAKKIKGNIQTLYHFHWEGMDPYKPKIMIRIGVDFSLNKREEKHWEKKLKEVKQGLKK